MDQVIQFVSNNAVYVIAGVVAISGAGFIVRKRGLKKTIYSFVAALDDDLDTVSGQEKLDRVYKAFALRYPLVEWLVPESQFAIWVDEALEKIRNKLEG